MRSIGNRGSVMAVRVRFFFAKRGRSAFFPHVELPPIFVRSARRAGLEFEYSEGCVPHPRLSLGPTLPLGIVALEEPAEGWFSSFPADAAALWGSKFPPGLEMIEAFPVEGPPLAAVCPRAHYLLRPRRAEDLSSLEEALAVSGGGDVRWHRTSEGLSVTMGSERSMGGVLRAFGEISPGRGWRDVFVVRLRVGPEEGDGVRSLREVRR